MARKEQAAGEEAMRVRLDYGARLRALRIAAGYPTVKAAADKSGVSEPQMRLWELGRSIPSVPSLAHLFDSLGIDPASYFGRKGV